MRHTLSRQLNRLLFRIALVVALIALLGGSAYAYLEYQSMAGPKGVVSDYFAALARADAPAALSYGDLPPGPHDLLTSAVLAQQQHNAALHDVQVTDVAEAGSEASVQFTYRLRFAHGDRSVTGTLQVRETDDGWRLTQTAVPVTVRVEQALDRLSLAGAAVPEGRTLLFPGAVPVRFDTPYLGLPKGTPDVRFGGPEPLTVGVDTSAAARTAMTTDVRRRLQACVSGPPPVLQCPLPSAQIVPGSLHGRLVSDLSTALRFTVSSSATGTIAATGTVEFRGRYRQLAYDNVPEPRTGTLRLRVNASAYAVRPLQTRFVESTP